MREAEDSFYLVSAGAFQRLDHDWILRWMPKDGSVQFENLTNKFEEILSSLKKAPSLNEAQVDEGLRKIRQALLEADVALPVAKE